MATTNMGMVLPVEGADDGEWDTIINTALEDVIDVHDHTHGNGVKVPTAGLDIDDDLDFGGHSINTLLSTRYSTQTAGALTTKTLGIGVIANELTWVTAAGVEVPITNGLGLDGSSLGGITGDYATTTADLEYVDSTNAYELKQAETPDFFAKVKCADLHLYEETSGVTNYVALKSPGSLTATYTVTFPAAVPAATSLVLMSAAGVLTTSLTPTLTTLETTGLLTGNSLAVTTSATVGTTLGVTGLATFTAGAKMKNTGAGSDTLSFFAEDDTGNVVPEHDGTPFTSITSQMQYQKIGNWVTVHAYMEFTAPAGVTGEAITVTGLPFTVSTGGGATEDFIGIVSQFNPSAGETNPGSVFCSTGGGTTLQIKDDPANPTNSFNITAGANKLQFQISYRCA